MINIFNKTLFFAAMAVMVASVMSTILGATPVYASAKSDVCSGVGLTSSNGTDAGCQVTSGPDANSVVSTVVNILSIVVGILAVIFIIIGGIKYITSSGEANNITSAKNTIMYAIVGLVIVALAQVIVRFVLHRVVTACPSGQHRDSGDCVDNR